VIGVARPNWFLLDFFAASLSEAAWNLNGLNLKRFSWSPLCGFALLFLRGFLPQPNSWSSLATPCLVELVYLPPDPAQSLHRSGNLELKTQLCWSRERVYFNDNCCCCLSFFGVTLERMKLSIPFLVGRFSFELGLLSGVRSVLGISYLHPTAWFTLVEQSLTLVSAYGTFIYCGGFRRFWGDYVVVMGLDIWQFRLSDRYAAQQQTGG